MKCENRQIEKDRENQNERKRRKQKEIKGKKREKNILKLIRKLGTVVEKVEVEVVIEKVRKRLEGYDMAGQ